MYGHPGSQEETETQLGCTGEGNHQTLGGTGVDMGALAGAQGLPDARAPGSLQQWSGGSTVGRLPAAARGSSLHSPATAKLCSHSHAVLLLK